MKLFGYEVLVARTSVEAVEMAASQVPDIIVMDMVLPGWTVLRRSLRYAKILRPKPSR